VLVIDLVGDELLPQDPRHGPKQGAGIGSEGPRLDERGADPATELLAPIDAVADRHAQPPGLRPFAKSRWNADAVGSDWPWYFEPSSGEPYGRSTGDDILKNEIWPIFIPK